MSRSLRFSIPAVLFLCLGTALFFKFHERYEFNGPELLGNPQFQYGFSQWKHSGEIGLFPQTGEAALDSTAITNATHLTQTISGFKQYILLKFAGDLKITNVRIGNAYWKKARIVLIFYGNSGKGLYYLPYVLVEKTGDSDWERHERVFRVPVDAVEARVSILLQESTGNMRVKNLSLRPVTETQSFRRYRLVLITVWLVVLAWIAGCVIRSRPSIIRQPMFILIAMAVVVGTLLPQQVKGVLDQHIRQVALYASTLGQKTLNKPAVAQPEHHLALPVSPIFSAYKAGHVLMFTLFSFVAFRIKPQKLPAWQLVIYLLVFALCTEVLQFFIEGRESRWYDIVIDAIGITLGVAAWLLRKIMQKQH